MHTRKPGEVVADRNGQPWQVANVLTERHPHYGETVVIGYEVRPAKGNRREGAPAYLNFFLRPDQLEPPAAAGG